MGPCSAISVESPRDFGALADVGLGVAVTGGGVGELVGASLLGDSPSSSLRILSRAAGIPGELSAGAVDLVAVSAALERSVGGGEDGF